MVNGIVAPSLTTARRWEQPRPPNAASIHCRRAGPFSRKPQILHGALALFTVSFLVLMYLGLQPAQGAYVMLARIFTVCYFAFFILMPWYTRAEKTKPVPERLTMR